MLKIMTPGPTQVRENVRLSRSLPTTNPDLDPRFYDYYRDTCSLAGRLVKTQNPVYILSGEAILGLEAACASLTEPGCRVLVIDNGVYGKGFADFVKLYGGEPVIFQSDYHRAVDINELSRFLEQDHDFAYATLVHCDTPSGVLNDISRICPLLHEYGILSVVDAVSSMFGEPIKADESCIDILCGGSQKALSAPPGLTIIAVSPAALRYMENRKSPVASFYANLLQYKDYYQNKWFPYTMPISDIYGLRTALENISADPDIYSRHASIGTAVRAAVVKSGLSLYLDSGYSNTVTVIRLPDSLNAADITERMAQKHQIMIAGSFDIFTGKVIRIGHMGENCRTEDITLTLEALSETLCALGFPLKSDLKAEFLNSLNS